MRVQLTAGAYQSASLIASAQRCINLYPENIPPAQGEPVRTTDYPTPGLRLLTTLPTYPVRGAYTASNGDLYAVGGSTLYYVSPSWVTTSICTLQTSSGPVSMMDNTLDMIVVDGSARGSDASTLWGGVRVNLATRAPSTLPTEAQGFYGADRVDYLGTFFALNKPNTPQFYVSDSLAVSFNALDFANKSDQPDYLVAPVSARGQLWLIGRASSEVWTISGASDFPFQQLQGVLIEHGCAAVGSIAKSDGSIFFISLDKQGRSVVLKASGYQALRISTHAIEATFSGYVVSDAIGYCYQLRGHVFYALSFPTSDATWVFDEATNEWHQWASYDVVGLPHRHRSNCHAFAYDTAVVGDYQSGALYALDNRVYTDNGMPIQRTRSFPHMVDDDNRIVYHRFVADLDVATLVGSVDSAPPLVTLRYSDDRGVTYGAPQTQSIGAADQTYTSVQYRRLGYARDRVFELSWNAPAPIALNGAFIDVGTASS